MYFMKNTFSDVSKIRKILKHCSIILLYYYLLKTISYKMLSKHVFSLYFQIFLYKLMKYLRIYLKKLFLEETLYFFISCVGYT